MLSQVPDLREVVIFRLAGRRGRVKEAEVPEALVCRGERGNTSCAYLREWKTLNNKDNRSLQWKTPLGKEGIHPGSTSRCFNASPEVLHIKVGQWLRGSLTALLGE